MFSKKRRTCILLLVIGLVLTACGNKGKEEQQTVPKPETPTEKDQPVVHYPLTGLLTDKASNQRGDCCHSEQPSRSTTAKWVITGRHCL